MSTLTATAPQGKGRVEIAEEPLGKGGEGSVFVVKSIEDTLDFLPDADNLVAKIYHQGQGNKNKVRSMLLSPPDSESVAWPLAALFRGKEFVGFLMKKLDFKNNRPWADLAHSGTRRKTAQDFDVMYAMTAVRNFAVALSDVHEAGHRVGDINESNMFVSGDAQVMLVDTDSAQVEDPKTSTIHKCMVGKPEYTAAEISHGKLADHERTIETDVFGFAVAAYQMLLGGPHPADGIYKGNDDPPPVIEKIRKGVFPGLQGGKNGRFKAPPRVAISGVPKKIQEVLLQALDPDPSVRPDIDSIVDVFDEVTDDLEQCSNVKQHWFSKHEGICGWCKHAERTGIDPWVPEQKAPTTKGSQNSRGQKQLGGVVFDSRDGEGAASPGTGKPKRLPPQRAGANNPQSAGYTGSQGSVTPQGYQQNTYPPGQGYPQQQYGAQGQMQGHNGYPVQPPPQQYQPPTQKELQKQFKTSKTVLQMNDGRYVPRPSIGELMKSNPKLAFSCLRDETPSWAAFWWSNRSAVPIWWSLLVGLLIAVGAAFAWWTYMPQWLNTGADYMEWDYVWLRDYIFVANTYVATFGVMLTSVWMTISGLLDDLREKKKHGSLKNLNKEPWIITILRYISISIVWGPILMVGSVVLIVLVGSATLINGISKEVSESRYR